MKEICLMKIIISLNNKENSAANDVFGSFGSDLRTKEFIQKGRFEATAKGFYNPFGGYVGMIEIPDWLVLGTAQILMNHKRAIKGVAKTIDGLCDMMEGLINGLRRDFFRMVEDHNK